MNPDLPFLRELGAFMKSGPQVCYNDTQKSVFREAAMAAAGELAKVLGGGTVQWFQGDRKEPGRATVHTKFYWVEFTQHPQVDRFRFRVTTVRSREWSEDHWYSWAGLHAHPELFIAKMQGAHELASASSRTF